MVERAVAAAEAGSARDRALDVGASAVDGIFDPKALGEAGGDRRGESAAGAVGVAGIDPGALPDPCAPPGDEDVGHSV